MARSGARGRRRGLIRVSFRDRVLEDLLPRCSFPERDHLQCAVSGGADSAALLILAAATGCRVTAYHVDHGLRSESGAEAARVAVLAEAVGAEMRCIEVEVGDGANLEARARAARYGVLPDGILVGHTADDLAETVLLQLFRGGALDALASMDPGDRSGASVVRPLLSLRRSETEAVCAAFGYEPVQDEWNQDERFARVRIRAEVLPLLEDVMGRDPVPLLGRAARLARDERDLIEQLAEGIDPTDVRALRTAPRALARRAVRSWLRDEYPPDAAAVDRVLDVALGLRQATEVGGSGRVARTGGRLRIEGPSR